jgi:glucans biosynthesis protein
LKDPNDPLSAARAAPRCLARTRRGTPCQLPAIRGRKRCKLHGGRSTGPPLGNSNALKHGLRSAAVQADREILRALRKQLAKLAT